MKAHKFKAKLTTQEEVWQEFNAQIQQRIDSAVFEKIGACNGILHYMEFKHSEDGVKLVAEIELELIKEWERKGRNMAFLKSDFNFNFMNLLNKKLTGKSLK